MCCDVQSFSAKLWAMNRYYLRLRFILRHQLLLLIILSSPLTHAQKSKQKSKLNTQVFESEGQANTFTGKVRIIRDNTSETEVFFEDKKNPGPYTLSDKIPSYGLFKERLQKSKKTGGPKVKVNIDNDQITGVDIDGSATSETVNEKDLINSVFKK